MREIRFRGKRKDTGAWVYGLLAKTRDGQGGLKDCIMVEHPSEDRVIFLIVDPETVGQFTGLCDESDKEIYEGDIVKAHYTNAKRTEDILEIQFDKGRFEAVKKLGGQGHVSMPIADGIPQLEIDKSPYMDSCEVLGNIYDSPELLGERVAVD